MPKFNADEEIKGLVEPIELTIGGEIYTISEITDRIVEAVARSTNRILEHDARYCSELKLSGVDVDDLRRRRFQMAKMASEEAGNPLPKFVTPDTMPIAPESASIVTEALCSVIGATKDALKDVPFTRIKRAWEYVQEQVQMFGTDAYDEDEGSEEVKKSVPEADKSQS